MEKISRVVRGNARVASTDLKNAAPVRPGTPSFGRPIGESTTASPGSGSTAAKAVALHKEMQAAKKEHTESRIVQDMADKFFLNRVREPEENTGGVPEGEIPVQAPGEEKKDDEIVIEPPKGYTPRGSFVDVRA